MAEFISFHNPAVRRRVVLSISSIVVISRSFRHSASPPSGLFGSWMLRPRSCIPPQTPIRGGVSELRARAPGSDHTLSGIQNSRLRSFQGRAVIAGSNLPQDDHLAVRITAGLEKDRVHARLGDRSRGHNLEMPGPAHIKAF